MLPIPIQQGAKFCQKCGRPMQELTVCWNPLLPSWFNVSAGCQYCDNDNSTKPETRGKNPSPLGPGS